MLSIETIARIRREHFDVRGDHFEQKNLLDQQTERADEYQKAVARLLETSFHWNREFVSEQRSDDLNEQLRSLGYVE